MRVSIAKAAMLVEGMAAICFGCAETGDDNHGLQSKLPQLPALLIQSYASDFRTVSLFGKVSCSVRR